MISKLAKRITSKFRKKPAPPTVPLEVSKPDWTVLLWAPAYDELTRHVSSWFQGIRLLDEVPKQANIGNTISQKEIADILQATQAQKTIKIFGGHGTSNALLGPPHPNHPKISLNGRSHSILYTADMTLSDTSCLFAFACEAGQLLGEDFCSSNDRSFLGYKNTLFFEVANQECIDSWRTVFQTMASKIARTGKILPEYEQHLKDLYYREFLYFENGVGKKNNRRFLMLMYLDQHRDSTVRHPR